MFKSLTEILYVIEQRQSLRRDEICSKKLTEGCENSGTTTTLTEKPANSRHSSEGPMNLDDVYGSGEWLKAADLGGRQVVVKIEKISTTTFEDKRNKTTKQQVVLHFEGKEKKLGLNWTNAKKVADITGSRNTEDWVGYSIMLYPTEVEAFGETTEAIRIRAVPNAQRPAPAPVVHDDPVDDDIPF